MGKQVGCDNNVTEYS